MDETTILWRLEALEEDSHPPVSFSACGICHALVAEENLHDHSAWHDSPNSIERLNELARIATQRWFEGGENPNADQAMYDLMVHLNYNKIR